MTKKQLAARLRPHKQEHVLHWWSDLSESQRNALASQVASIDLDLIAHEMRRGPLAPEPDFLAQFEPPPVVKPSGSRDDAQAKATGEAMLRAGEVGLVLVAGGQGTRLGYNAPKGTFPIMPLSGKTLFELHAEKIRALEARHDAELPLYVMTSTATDDATRTYFAEHDHLGLGAGRVRFFRQDNMPVVDRDGRLIMSAKHAIAMSPNGHGGTVPALAKSGMLDDMRGRGVRDLFYFQVDNVLVKIADPVFMGYHRLRSAQMSLKVLEKREPEEGLGVVGCVGRQFHVVEYSDLDKDHKYRRDSDGRLTYRMGSIAIHAFTVDFLGRMSRLPNGLPIHQAKKAVSYLDEDGHLREPEAGVKNAIKFETFIFDVLPQAENALVFETVREEDFAPVKNAEGPDSPQTAKQALIDLWGAWLDAAGSRLPRDANGHVAASLEISPLFAQDADDLRERLGNDAFRLDMGQAR